MQRESAGSASQRAPLRVTDDEFWKILSYSDGINMLKKNICVLVPTSVCHEELLPPLSFTQLSGLSVEPLPPHEETLQRLFGRKVTQNHPKKPEPLTPNP